MSDLDNILNGKGYTDNSVLNQEIKDLFISLVERADVIGPEQPQLGLYRESLIKRIEEL